MTIFLGMLIGVYNRSLKWAWEDAWQSDDPLLHIPDFRENVVSSGSYLVDKESIGFAYFLWKILLEMVDKAKLPLPLAKKLFLQWWQNGIVLRGE